MRSAGTFHVLHIVVKSGASNVQSMPPDHYRSIPQAAVTGWKSPVPYLFGGLAAMLGLIAFALLILACSYWKLSGYLDENTGEDGGDGDGEVAAEKAEATAAFRNSVLVIMAGEEKPTFLATPATSRTTSFGDTCLCSCSSSSSNSNGSDNGGDDEEKGDRTVELTTNTITTTIPPHLEEEKS